MAMTREDMLRELELLPAWKLREPEAVNHEKARSLIESPVASEAISPEVLELPIEINLAIKTVATNIEVEPEIVHVTKSAEINISEINSAGIDNAGANSAGADRPELGARKINVAEQKDKAVLYEQRTNTIQQMDWQSLQECVKDCQACDLAATRTQTVFGIGDANADWLIIGEAPDEEEDHKGVPFIGPPGHLLDNMLAAIQLKRSDNVYITNVLKCRPPENRDPQGEEIMECALFLKRQVELIKPKLILALGKSAAQSLLQSENTIDSMRGQLHQYNDVPVIVTYHPAYLLRNLADKAKAWEDLCFARKTMQSL